MLEPAQINPGMKMLEPSAGLGHICQEARKLGVEPDCFEFSPLLRRGLLLQGFSVIGDNFLSSTPTAIYDRILANPPFSGNGVAPRSFLDKTGHPLPTQTIHEAQPTTQRGCPVLSGENVTRHTLHALDWLRPGGRLVTVAHHYQLKPSATDRAFFQWLHGFDAQFYDCGQAFVNSSRPCNSLFQLILINKPCW